MSWVTTANTVLENEHVKLHPLRRDDYDALHSVAMEPAIWRYFVSMVSSDEDFDRFFGANLADQTAGRRVVYVITDKSSGRVAGSMSFGNLAESDGRLEIGWSWLGRDFRGRGVNRWAKYLMLEHAFERMSAQRVEFKTDQLNEQARRGLRNIGAVEEGVLRSFNPMPGGRRRDAIYYSILRAEWPQVKDQLARSPKVLARGTPS
ncbi:GNAT family N-acetyltransferase [Micromonospora sp. HNM0581]|uniref:GNAT family N-acetyltransferase n=1 Tax=Micromonospora sp. HNM0581 TaxID=2716341 RepID=UPI00146F2C67|nr:GNAT family N-acetyltransferase [Micromonospora sp. HNM0581]NLU80649.1 GNAT family N-acetyltransferase [Micromonospora sp. HNM0581]